MKKLDLIRSADIAYRKMSDGILSLSPYYDKDAGSAVFDPHGGDTLALFVVVEINDLVGEEVDAFDVFEVRMALERAAADLQAIADALVAVELELEPKEDTAA